jgi:hypothetical protein
MNANGLPSVRAPAPVKDSVPCDSVFLDLHITVLCRLLLLVTAEAETYRKALQRS